MFTWVPSRWVLCWQRVWTCFNVCWVWFLGFWPGLVSLYLITESSTEIRDKLSKQFWSAVEATPLPQITLHKHGFDLTQVSNRERIPSLTLAWCSCHGHFCYWWCIFVCSSCHFRELFWNNIKRRNLIKLELVGLLTRLASFFGNSQVLQVPIIGGSNMELLMPAVLVKHPISEPRRTNDIIIITRAGFL